MVLRDLRCSVGMGLDLGIFFVHWVLPWCIRACTWMGRGDELIRQIFRLTKTCWGIGGQPNNMAASICCNPPTSFLNFTTESSQNMSMSQKRGHKKPSQKVRSYHFLSGRCRKSMRFGTCKCMVGSCGATGQCGRWDESRLEASFWWRRKGKPRRS